MNIGFEAKRVFQNLSGLGNYSRNAISILCQFYPENKYVLYAPKVTNLYSCGNSVELVAPNYWFFKFRRSYWRLNIVAKLLKNKNIDIFHGLSHVLPYNIEKTGIPTVVTMHDLIFLRFPQFYKWIDRKIYKSVYLSSCHRASKIIAISKQTKSDLVDFLGINPDKIEVIYQTCNKLFYEKVSEAQKSAVKAKFNLPEKFILTVGTIERRKNQLSVVKAVLNEMLDIPVVILGRPRPKEYLEEVKRFIAEKGMESQVIFLHNTNTDELHAIYQMAEMMIYPSFFEGFGLPVLEAQAAGCPVITSNLSSLPEAGGNGALYIDPSDIDAIGSAIKKLLSNNELRNNMIIRGNENAADFSEKLAAERLMKLYVDLLAKSK